ncbi:MAG: bifunctional tRNA (5-methylaminomethyl-2-thiouridine)(34)-methyltransferase MnmD/FAD-dependent 5-carboxymethylaminomethyl-2-thiouridine(34) oxidoreductase MnmC [Proteobacteria bacterium]|nr:MAG: bifunctional tRNA (5-methylaminomethyl-2-thiouridine)(34)-methyltransferase MnmD/FAD-dependent 5-carboxymethylaminomethyl-2-thiouridine(34) oxidoreductase MnmC [Pseudomonadota bacterium]
MKKADLFWNEDTPISKSFDEGYFSSHGGLEESSYVFLNGNNLPNSWEEKQVFCIGESGFGTGLNFLNVLKLYDECKKKPKELYFISVEKEPLSLEDLKKAHSFFPEISKYAKKLYHKYPPLSEGLHFLNFGSVKLILCFGDIKDVFSNLTCKVNAWFLDGFSPSKNPDMWDEQTLKLIKNLSAKNATLATFSVARVLRDNLNKVGFTWEKSKGFANKKHMLKATLTSHEATFKKPWFAPPNPTKERKAIILGAGIAGASLAYKLAQRGWEIDIIDKEKEAGSGGSGNHCGAVTPLITLPQIELGQMYERAFLQAVDFYKGLGIGEFKGLKHYAYDKTYLKRWEAWAKRGSEIFSLCEDKIGKYFQVHQGGYLQPFRACRDLVNGHENIKFYGDCEIKSFTYEGGIYEVKTSKKTFQAPVLIVALGVESEKFLNSHSWNLQKIRGQVSFLDEAVKTEQPLCAKGYICPYIDGRQVIGATYIKDDECLQVRAEDNEQNLANVKEFLSCKSEYDPKKLEGRVSYRCSNSDRFPLIGAVGDVEFYKSEYKALPWKKHKPHLFKKAKYLPNLFISTAHGSRGLVSSILGANIITAMLEDLPIPLEESLLHALHPERFTIRRLQRQEVW